MVNAVLLTHVMKFPTFESELPILQQLFAVKLAKLLAPYKSSSKPHMVPNEVSVLASRFLFFDASSEFALTTVLIFDTLT